MFMLLLCSVLMSIFLYCSSEWAPDEKHPLCVRYILGSLAPSHISVHLIGIPTSLIHNLKLTHKEIKALCSLTLMSGTHTSSIFFKVLGALSVNYYLIYTWCRRLRVEVPAVLVGGLFSAWAAGGLLWWRSVSPGSSVVGAPSLSLGGAGLVRGPLSSGLTTSSAVRRLARWAAGHGRCRGVAAAGCARRAAVGFWSGGAVCLCGGLPAAWRWVMPTQRWRCQCFIVWSTVPVKVLAVVQGQCPEPPSSNR